MITCDKPCVCGTLSLSLWVVSPLLLSVLIVFDCLLLFPGAFAQFRLFMFSVIPSVMINFFLFCQSRSSLPGSSLFHIYVSGPLRKDFSVLKGSFSRSSLFSFLSVQTPPPPLLVCHLLLISVAGS